MRLAIARWTVLLSCFLLGAGTLSACSGGDEPTVESVANELEDNVEQSSEIMKDTYEEARAQGEDAVEAAGDAYEGVLEEGREKAEEKK